MIGQLSKSGRWLARVALVPTNPDAGRSPRSTTSRRDAPTQRASEALTTRRLGDDRTGRDGVPAMTDVDRIYLGETDRRYVCDGCDGWCRWSGWATLAGGSASRPTAAWAGPDTGPLDRPAPGTPYRCTRCGREHVHTRNVPLKDPSDLVAMAASTPGMVGADLKNLVNEAALNAARRGEQTVSREDFSNALERITIGAARRIVLSEEERQRTAYHESGHALLGMLQPGADPVRKISIIPRGQALGVTYQSPDADRYGYGETYLRGRLIGMLGGRAAEILIYGETTTGPESDLEQATSIARQMVGRWGMSEEVGAVSAFPRSGGDGYMPAGELSQHTLEKIDEEIRRIISECAEEAKRQLAEHREQLDHLAQTLLERETLDEADAYAAAGIPQSASTTEAAVPAAR